MKRSNLNAILPLLFLLFQSKVYAQGMAEKYTRFQVSPFVESESVIEGMEDNFDASPGSYFTTSVSFMESSLNPSMTSCDNSDGRPTSLFSDQIEDLVDPFKKCYENNIDKMSDKENYCKCISDRRAISLKDFEAVSLALKDEADDYAAEIAKSNMLVLQDKLMATVALLNGLSKSYDLKSECTPERIIDIIKEHGNSGSCAKGKMRELDKFFSENNVYEHFIKSIEETSLRTKDKVLDKKEFQSSIQELAPLLEKASQYNKGNLSLSDKDLQQLKIDLEQSISKIKIISHFQLELVSPNGSQRKLGINQIPGQVGSSIELPNLLDIYNEMKNKDSKNSDPLRATRALIGGEIRNISKTCEQLPLNIDFICSKALDKNYALAKIQNNPLHMAKIIQDKMSKGDFVARYSGISDFSKFTDPLKLPASQFTFPNGIQTPTNSSDGQELSRNVDLFQCAYSYPALVNSIVVGKVKDKQFDDIFAMSIFTSPVNSTIGKSRTIRDLDTEATLFDPYKKLQQAEDSQLAKAVVTVGKDAIEQRLDPTKNAKRRRPSATEFLNRTFGTDSAFSQKPSDALGKGGTSSSSSIFGSPSSSSSSTSSPVTTSSSTGQGYAPTSFTPLSSGTFNGSSSIDDLPKTPETKTPDGYQSLIDSYEQRLATMMEKMAEMTAKKSSKQKEAEASNNPADEEELAEISEEENQLKSTIGELKNQIKVLQDKKTQIQDTHGAEKTKSNRSFEQAVKRPQGSHSAESVNAPATQHQGKNISGPISSSAMNNGISSSSSSSASHSSLSSQPSSKDFVLRAEDVNLEGKVVLSSKEFKMNDQKFAAELYEKANGQPVYVTQTLPDGTEEVLIYEAVKLPDGTITYVPKKLTAEEKKDAKAKKPAEASLKKEKDKNRKRVKVQDLNQLMQTVK